MLKKILKVSVKVAILLGASILLFYVIVYGFLIILLADRPIFFTKNKIRDCFETYNTEYSLNLPDNFKKIYTETKSSQDSQYVFIVVETDDDYVLEYENQCESTVHENFDFSSHFFKACDFNEELSELGNKVSYDYDWYAYEQREGYRVYHMFVLRDNKTNYLYVFYIVSQYEDTY